MIVYVLSKYAYFLILESCTLAPGMWEEEGVLLVRDHQVAQ